MSAQSLGLCPKESEVVQEFVTAVLENDRPRALHQVSEDVRVGFDETMFRDTARSLSRAETTRFWLTACTGDEHDGKTTQEFRFDSDAQGDLPLVALAAVEQVAGTPRITWFKFARAAVAVAPKAAALDGVQIAMLWAAVIAVITCLSALWLWWRNANSERRWWWAPYIVTGLFPIFWDGDSNILSFEPLMVTFFCGQFWREAANAPWSFGAALPVGAIHFLWRRRRMARAGADPTSKSPAVPLATPSAGSTRAPLAAESRSALVRTCSSEHSRFEAAPDRSYRLTPHAFHRPRTSAASCPLAALVSRENRAWLSAYTEDCRSMNCVAASRELGEPLRPSFAPTRRIDWIPRTTRTEA